MHIYNKKYNQNVVFFYRTSKCQYSQVVKFFGNSLKLITNEYSSILFDLIIQNKPIKLFYLYYF